MTEHHRIGQRNRAKKNGEFGRAWGFLQGLKWRRLVVGVEGIRGLVGRGEVGGQWRIGGRQMAATPTSNFHLSFCLFVFLSSGLFVSLSFVFFSEGVFVADRWLPYHFHFHSQIQSGTRPSALLISKDMYPINFPWISIYVVLNQLLPELPGL